MSNAPEDTRKTIVLFSPDVDFCMSLRLLFQDRFQMITTTDPEMLLTLARVFQPDLVIVDALPTRGMRRRFESIRQQLPHAQIMVFYVSLFDDRQIHETLRRHTDAAFSKPIDLGEVTKRINDLVMGDA